MQRREKSKMAPFVPEELDVFTIPHSRMKELVSGYVEKVCANLNALWMCG